MLPVRAESPLPTSLPADEIELKAGVTYSQPAGKVLKLDLVRPRPGTDLRPAVVCIHGGGWRFGDRESMLGPYARYLAAYGFVAVTPDYRLAPDDRFPAAVADVRNVVRWLRRRASDYGIDPKRIGVTGLSAGGHLACMVGLADDQDRFGKDDTPQPGESARVQAVVNFFGPADMASKDWPASAVKQYVVPFMGGAVADLPEAYRRASPVMYVSRDDPPILSFQGRIDNVVPASMAVALHRKLDQAGVANQLVLIKGQGHGWGEPHLTRTRQQMVRFFNEHLRMHPPATQPAAQ